MTLYDVERRMFYYCDAIRIELPARVIGQSATARVRIRVACNGELSRRTVTARTLRMAKLSEYPDWDQQWEDSNGQKDTEKKQEKKG